MRTDHDLILYVDDQVHALKYFRLGFGRQYQVRTAASVAEAWEVLEREGEKVALVISDQRMPGKTGLELLEEVKERFPRMLRLLTTAYADLNSAIAAVNRGSVYAYINKPWNLEELQLTIRRAFDYLRLQRERDLLLVEKLGVYQHLLLIDRLRSLGLLASVCTAWIRSPWSGAAAFWRDGCAHFTGEVKDIDPAGDLCSEMLAVTRRLAEDGRRLGAWLQANRPASGPAEVEAADLVARLVLARPQLGPGTSSGSARIADGPQLLAAGLGSLAGWLLDRIDGCEGAATGTVEAHGNGQGLVVSLAVSGGDNPAGAVPGDLPGLQAYLAVHHYGGSVMVDAWTRSGGRIEIRIPTLPRPEAEDQGLADLQSALTRMER